MLELKDINDEIFKYRTQKEGCISSFQSKIKTKTLPGCMETMCIVEAGLFDDLYSMSLNGDMLKDAVFNKCDIFYILGRYGPINFYKHAECTQSCFCFNLRKYIGLCYYFDVNLWGVNESSLDIYDPLIFQGAIHNKYIDIDTKQRCLNLCKCDYYDKWINVFPTYFPKDIFNIIIELLIFNYYDYPKI
jgi:hypothetical protein